MTRDNKILLSLLPYENEELKLKMLRGCATYKEIMRAVKYYGCKNIDERIKDINNYNTVFYDEKKYPNALYNLAIPPLRIQSSSCFPMDNEKIFGLVTSRNTSYQSFNGIMNFVLELIKNKTSIMSIDSTSNIIGDEIFKKKGLKKYSILSHGIDDCTIACNDSTLLSMYEPKEKENKSKRYSMYEVFGILCEAIVLFEINGIYGIDNLINSTLDNGGSIYLNRIGQKFTNKYSKAFQLILAGAPIISNLGDIDDYIYDYVNHKVIDFRR